MLSFPDSKLLYLLEGFTIQADALKLAKVSEGRML